MNAEPPSQELPPEHRPIADVSSALPRLNFLLWLLGIYWALYFVVGSIDKPYFVGFIYGCLSSLIFALCFLVWWWRNRSIRLVEKAAGFFLIVAGIWVTAKYADLTIKNPLAVGMVGIPLTVTLIVAWLSLVRREILPSHRVGFVLAVAAPWALLLSIRTDGLDAALKSHVSWRWTPTPEEQFLAQHQSKSLGAAPANSPTVPTSLSVTNAGWPAFRGEDRDGVVHGTKIATDWTIPPSQVWRHKIGPAWSSLIVIGDRLYTQEQRGPKETVVCYDSTTGNELWVHEDETRFDEGVSGAGPRATPTFAQGRIFSLHRSSSARTSSFTAAAKQRRACSLTAPTRATSPGPHPWAKTATAHRSS
jgi:hypothetical protein